LKEVGISKKKAYFFWVAMVRNWDFAKLDKTLPEEIGNLTGLEWM
jgi:hypothetical protein